MSSETFRLGKLFCGPGGIAYGTRTAQSDNGEKTMQKKDMIITPYVKFSA